MLDHVSQAVANGHVNVIPVCGYQLAAPHPSMTRAINNYMYLRLQLLNLAVLISDLLSICYDRDHVRLRYVWLFTTWELVRFTIIIIMN